MDAIKVVFSAFIISLALLLIYFGLNFINIEKKYEESITNIRVSFDDIANNLWNSCLNSTLFSLTNSELTYLSNYDCSVMDCLKTVSYPYYFEIYSDVNVTFGICPLDKNKCEKRDFITVIEKNSISKIRIYLCYDDLSIFTIISNSRCLYNLSYYVRFSEKRDVKIDKDLICVDGICNKIQCNNFPTMDIKNVVSLYFEYDKNRNIYEVYKIK